MRCEEGVTRKGEQQPCDKTAVAYRRDPEDGCTYPVCAYHSRGDMVPVQEVLTTAWVAGHAACSHSCATYEGLGEPCRNPYEEAS